MAGLCTWFAAVNVPTVASIVRRRQEGKLRCDAVSGCVEMIARHTPITWTVRHARSRRTDVKVHTIAKIWNWPEQRTSNDTKSDVGHIIVRASAIGPAS